MIWLALLAGCPSEVGKDTLLTQTTPESTPPIPADDCSDYTFNGVIYDCNLFDPCDLSAGNIPMRVACCDCDELYCEPPEDCPPDEVEEPDVCSQCHGIEDAHPSSGALCVDCHGGDPAGLGMAAAHVPTPPDLTDLLDPRAHFRYVTRAGLETELDYLQFLNPGDARVVEMGRSCGRTGCHEDESAWFANSPIRLGTGIYSTSMYAIGAPPAQAAGASYSNTGADFGFVSATDAGFAFDAFVVGPVGSLLPFPERAIVGDPVGIWQNDDYDAFGMVGPQLNGQVAAGSPLQDLVASATLFLCSDCHAGNSGSLMRTGQFRSGGCTSCHMPYAEDGRYQGADANISSAEPASPDALVPPERAHVRTHLIVENPADETCATCHSGTNETALQFWGIRVDASRDVALGFQYPANPFGWQTPSERFTASQTWLGRTEDQYLSFEDYDGDGRDDTPADIHFERGLGCVDCHGSRDLHGGMAWLDEDLVPHLDPSSGRLVSRQDQGVGIRCTSCHGTVTSAPESRSCIDDSGVPSVCLVDAFGDPLDNVYPDASQDVWLRSRLDGVTHYVPQLRDVVVDTGKTHPLTGEPLYSANASMAMGTADGDPANGTGPEQVDPDLYALGFSHLEDLACEACHAAWTTSCVGCHLEMTYDEDPSSELFSLSTGDPVTMRASGQVVYASPVLAMLEVGSSGKITLGQHGTGTFWSWTDRTGQRAGPFAFSDRNEAGNNPFAPGASSRPALAHGRVMPHSIRGRVDDANEGVRHCVACHLNEQQMADQGAEYTTFYDAMLSGVTAQLDYAALVQQIGQNPGNQLNSPFYVHRMAGLGSGLLQFDATGCPTNPLDSTVRAGCPTSALLNVSPVAFDLDRVVNWNGVPNGSWTRPSRDPSSVILRAGAPLPTLAGPLGAELVYKLADPTYGLVLDTWVDADGVRRP